MISQTAQKLHSRNHYVLMETTQTLRDQSKPETLKPSNHGDCQLGMQCALFKGVAQRGLQIKGEMRMYTIKQIVDIIIEKTNIRAKQIIDRGDSRAHRNHTRYVESASRYIEAIGKITNVKLANQHVEVFKAESLSAGTMDAMTNIILGRML